MIPSIFEYLPGNADKLFVKVAEASIREESFPEVVPPDALPGSTEPTLKRPPHPYWVGLKQELPIGAGIAAGAFLGAAAPYAFEKYILKNNVPVPNILLPVIVPALSGIAAHRYALASKEREAELNRAKQDYEDYLKRRAGSSSGPSVQPPPIRP